MNIFLYRLSKHIVSKKIVIVMDGAAWHKSHDLKIPDNIKIIIQPPYSPELNPVEKLWQYIKDKTIKNKFFESIRDLEASVSNFLKSLTKKAVSIICNIDYILLFMGNGIILT